MKTKLSLILLLCVPTLNAWAQPFSKKLSEELSACEAFQMSSLGYTRFAHSKIYLSTWTKDFIKKEIIPEMLKRERIGTRSSVELQGAYASSFQTAKGYDKLLKAMQETGAQALDRVTLDKLLIQIYKEKARAEGIAHCAIIKWGNRYSDFHAWPIYKDTLGQIEKIFLASEKLSLGQVPKLLSTDEYRELLALSQAGSIFEKQFEFLASDRGSWGGNMAKNAFVCTDEAISHHFFIEWLIERGLVKHFKLNCGKLVHRRPRILTDHFAVMLTSKQSGRVFVYDSWLRDGGEPVVISSIESWFNKKEMEENLIRDDLMNLDQSHSLRVVPDDRNVPELKDEFHFSLSEDRRPRSQDR